MRLDQLQPVSVQHLITGMQRFEADFLKHGKAEWLSDMLKQTTGGLLQRSITPIQSLAILMALQKMRYREPAVISKLIQGFVVGHKQVPDEYRTFYPASAWRQLPPCPFDVVATKHLWETKLDICAAAQVLQGFSTLECWSAESLWLGLFLKYFWVENRLHEMKAKEVISVAHAFKDWRLTDEALSHAESVLNAE